MFYEVKTINGVKTKVPLTNSSGVVAGGNPIGTIISTYKKIKPANYLYCDGSTFDPEIYPGLYLYLGTNTLPDYRECAMVGAEKNTTNVFDSTETDPSTGLPGTQSHDVYIEGEFKDDQFQGHYHTYRYFEGSRGTSAPSNVTDVVNLPIGPSSSIAPTRILEPISDGTNGTPRIGSTTHGKQKAVFYYIKAVDGVDITDESAIFEEINKHNSYSTTEEIATGATWIDGKPIYRKVFADMTGTTWTSARNLVGTINNLDKMVRVETSAVVGSTTNFVTNVQASSTAITGLVDMTNGNVYVDIDNISTSYPKTAIVEYTKTTD